MEVSAGWFLKLNYSFVTSLLIRLFVSTPVVHTGSDGSAIHALV